MVLRTESAVPFLVPLWFAAVLRGLNPALDRKGYWVHNAVIVGPARQPERSSKAPGIVARTWYRSSG